MQGAKKVEGSSKGTKILAKSFFKELRENGYDCNQILAISTELIDLVTRELKGEEVVAPSVEVSAEKAKVLAWRGKSV
jgi:hypothetical protein